MSKGAYIGVEGIARKVKKGYVGVDGVARKIKKAYIGVGGVARPFFGEAKLSYYGQITSLSVGRRYLASASIKSHAFFGGGWNGSDRNEVDVYDNSLVMTSADRLTNFSADLSAASSNTHVIFLGGTGGSGACAYDKNLVKTDLSTGCSCWGDMGCHFNGRALFGSGYQTACFDDNLVRSTLSSIRTYRYASCSATNGYAMFGGGYESSLSASMAYVDAYGSDFVKHYPTDLTNRVSYLASAVVNENVLFAGGSYNGSAPYSTVDSYNNDLTKNTITSLSAPRHYLAGSNVGGYAIFGGGSKAGTSSNLTDAYDRTLTKIDSEPLCYARHMLAATYVGNFILFGGGDYNSRVDAFCAS